MAGDKSLGKRWSTHPVVSGLYGLPGAVNVHEKVWVLILFAGPTADSETIYENFPVLQVNVL